MTTVKTMTTGQQVLGWMHIQRGQNQPVRGICSILLFWATLIAPFPKKRDQSSADGSLL